MFLSDRIDVTVTPAAVRFLIKPRRNVALWIFITICSVGWTLAGIAGIVAVVTNPTDRLFFGVWLCGCTAAFFLCWSTWLWNGFGNEHLLLTRESLQHQRKLFGRVLTRKCVPASEIRAIRASGPFESTISREQLLFTSGSITMECTSDCFVFGYQLEEPEAVALVEWLNSFLSLDENVSIKTKLA